MDKPTRSHGTPGVVLRDVAAADLLILYEQQLDPAATQMAAFPARDQEAFMAHWTRILADATIVKKTILYDGQVAGNIVSWEQGGEREIGYWIGRAYWGRGVATYALTEFLGHVEARPLYAQVAKHNTASLRVLQKCGFAVVGTAQDVASAPGDEVEDVQLILTAADRP